MVVVVIEKLFRGKVEIIEYVGRNYKLDIEKEIEIEVGKRK